MSWIQALYNTYDQLENDNEIVSSGRLLKPGHSTANAHLEVTIDKDGNYKDAQYVDKEHAVTVIPVTEDSGSRSSGIAPHPLFDKLKYIAGDFELYTKETNSDYYTAYMQGLKRWCDAKDTDKKIQAVFNYLDKGHLIRDLIAAGLLSVDESGLLTKKWENAQGYKLSVGNQEDAFVRFRVNGVDVRTALWEDIELQDKYVRFYLSQNNSDNKFCHVTGKYIQASMKHPAKIRNSGDKAKLISANDSTNFTYRGRFGDAEEAYTISYEASQKVHNALKWLIETQGVRVGEKVFVLWNVNGGETPEILTDTPNFIREEAQHAETAQDIAKGFNNAIRGYKGKLDNESHLVLLGIDAATTGRLAVVFYREYMGLKGNEQLIDNIDRWHKTCRWMNFYKNDKEVYVGYYGTPAPITIARAAFGTDQNGLLKGNDKLFSQVVERLLPCICDGRQIPRDVVAAAVNKAKMPQNFSSQNQWLQVVSVACSLYSRLLWDYNKEEITMAVKDTNDVAYNCGRLLAVADAIEGWALRDKAEDKKNIRQTTAIRYFTRFCQRPCETWGMINEKLAVYKEQLGRKGAKLYNLLGEISDKIDIKEFREASNLDGVFVLGFDSQRMDLYKRNESVESKVSGDEEN